MSIIKKHCFLLLKRHLLNYYMLVIKSVVSVFLNVRINSYFPILDTYYNSV